MIRHEAHPYSREISRWQRRNNDIVLEGLASQAERHTVVEGLFGFKLSRLCLLYAADKPVDHRGLKQEVLRRFHLVTRGCFGHPKAKETSNGGTERQSLL